MSNQHVYTDEQKQFIKDNIVGRTYQEMTDLFNAEFNTDLNVSRIKGTIARLKLKNGRNTRFYSGQASWNKDRKGLRYSPATEFKTGNTPHNWRPVGSERISKDGYIEVKVAEPGTWKLKHRLVWDKHNGPVPKGHAIIFADSDKLNCDISNLMLVSRRELLLINQHSLQKQDKELTGTGITVARLLTKVFDARKK